MPTYTTLAGERIEYAPAPAVADFVARLHAAAADPSVDLGRMTELVYGPENPTLDATVVPGRPLVTRAVFENPAYRVMADLIGVKRARLGGLDPAAADAAYTVSVADAAADLGITPASVRAAIAGGKLAGRMRNGQWYTRPDAVASYTVSNRGRKRTAAASDGGSPAASGKRLKVLIGSVPGISMSVRGATITGAGKHEERINGYIPDGWSRLVVKTTVGGRVRAFVIEPGEREHNVRAGVLFVEGPMTVVRRVNNPKEAGEVWDAAATA